MGSSRGQNYRQGRARRNLTAYYYSEMGEDESSEDDDWMHVGNMELRQAPVPPTKKKAFTGFSSLGNLFVKKDKKDVVVAVAADENKNDYHRKKKQPQHYSSEEQDDAQVIVLQQHEKGADEGEKKKENRFFQFFGNIGNKFTSVFKRNGGDKKHDGDEEKPVYHVNLQYTSSEEQSYHRPTKYVAPSYYSSEEGNKWQSWPPKDSSHSSKYPKFHVSAPLYYETEDEDRYRPYKHSSYKKKKVEYSSEEEYERPNRNPSKTKKKSSHRPHRDSQEEEREDRYRPSKNKEKNGPRFSPPADEKYGDVPLYNERSANFPKVRHEKRPQSFFYQERNINGEEITAEMEDEVTEMPEKKKMEKMPVKMEEQQQDEEEDEDVVKQEDEKVQKKVKPIRINRPYNFISIHNVRFDKCGRLWFIDVGTVERSTNSIFYRNPILWSFEVKVGKKGNLISRPYLRHEMEDTKPTGLRSLVVDIHEDCDDYHVYMPNSKDNRIVVYGSEVGEHWQFAHPSMAPVLKEVDKFTAGVYSLSLGMRDTEGYRDVYYTPASGTGQFKVSSYLLRDEQAARNKFNPKVFRFVGYRGKEGLTRSQVYDPRTEVLFSSSVEQSAVKCWNTNKLLTPDYYGTAYTNEDMIFGFDLKVSW